MTYAGPPTVETLAVKLTELEKRLDDRFRFQQASDAASEKALDAFKAASNEMRGMLSDAQQRFITTPVYDERHKALVNSYQDLKNRVAAIEGASTGRRSGISDFVMIAALIATVAAVALHVFFK